MTVLPLTRPPWPVDNAAAEKQEAQALGHTMCGISVLGIPATMIVREAEKLGADLIMLGSHGRQGLTRFVLGSVSHAVLHQAQCPVLVFE